MLNAIALIQAASGGPGIALIIQFAAIIAIFWFLLIRPQRKQQQKHKEMVEALKKGDQVVTEGGILGEVIHLAEDRITIKTAESTRIVVARQKIQRVFSPGSEESKES